MAQIAEELEDLGHTTKQLNKHSSMIQTQCEKIVVAQHLILEQAKKKKSVATNVVTRRGSETQGPKGPDWYEEEQAQKRRET